tara:strand:- start:3545 stop:3691 length:147 start_codon:yes stop_codon:yes gene_type:complete
MTTSIKKLNKYHNGVKAITEPNKDRTENTPKKDGRKMPQQKSKAEDHD